MIDPGNLTLEQLVSGYAADEGGAYTCITCGKVFEQGEIYQYGDRFFDAERSVKNHIGLEHKDRLSELISNKYLALTEKQKELLLLFYAGLSDSETAERIGVSASTVRHQRFMFREKAKAAKLYLAVWEMVEKNKNRQAQLLPVHAGATMVDERYEITEEESKRIIDGVFESLEPLKLKVFSSKEKKKIVILRMLAKQFKQGRVYTEKEVNAILGAVYEDYATLRRYLIEYGYMDRTHDCRTYWLK